MNKELGTVDLIYTIREQLVPGPAVLFVLYEPIVKQTDQWIYTKKDST
ncbi:hypothetical protein SNOG_10158 [Parastagonospora nodorum SN15]|uniref:Uncharacterized protein n=1 Tax=Phaeosphaeria nodorum (strain SN15 / ATCC MYA-4574 / FGSC 10173) TaxID=321614 RepID=Q0UDK6_PHANO|nr:hypothetical protein SNOG_10158 [Parastagonospora nodorum SN15]EAT82493.1 hypothetical protein SNOG_10158 [Parastagonospora nodorum SN15]